MAFVEVDGSIARLIRNCQKTLREVHHSLLKLPEDVQDASEGQRCCDEIGRLDMWDTETGASEGHLDHALRLSSRLRDGVVELLQDLTQLSAEALSQHPQPENPPSDSATAPAPEHSYVASSDHDSSLSTSSTDLSSPLHQTITELHEVVTCLLQLMSALQDPTPHDIRSRASYEGSHNFDQSHVRSKFPKASPELINRLGTANWRRREKLMFLRSKNENTVLEDGDDKDEFAPNADGEQDVGSEADVSAYSHSSGLGQESEITGELTTSSEMDSWQGTAMTSLTDNRGHKLQDLNRPVVAVEAHRLHLPRPPAPNSMFEGHQFKCPYCYRGLVEIYSFPSWKEHVMTDLEPYICTFGGCIRPGKTYGIKGDWIQHEVDVHQTRKTWSCRPCKTEFTSRKSFDDHMRNSHIGLDAEYQLDAFAKVCERSLGKIEHRTQCPLCLEFRHSDRKLRKHLADHLEQIALFAALPARQQLDSDDELDLMEDSGSDVETRPESLLLDAPDDTRAQEEIRKASVRKFLGDQARSNSAGESHVSGEISEPLETLPISKGPTVQFPVMTIGHPPNESFYGRDQDIAKIHESLSIPGDMCLIHGVGGVGKTLLAVEYAYRYIESYDCTFWLQADTAPGLAESYGEIAHALGLVQGNEDQGQVIGLSRDWMENTEQRWLLIFDNVEDWDFVLQYLPRDFYQSYGSVIITTQDSSLAIRVKHSLQLETFGEEDGSTMLLQYLERPNPKKDPERDLAQQISGLVGGLPVAISHVAGYVAYSQCSLSELLEIFKQRRRHTGAATSEDDDLPASFRQASFSYDETLAMVWNVTLRELSTDARDLTYILAYLNCEAVPESMLCAVHPEPFLEFLDSREKIRYERMKRPLLKRRLIQAKEIEGEPSLYLHRSLQRSIRETAAKSPAKRQEVFEQALIIVRKVFPASSPIQVPEPSSWREHQKLLPHVMSLHSAFVEAKSGIRGSRKFASLLSDAGINQWARGFTRDGLLLLETAEQVLFSISSDDLDTFDELDVMRADVNAIIALMHDNTGISTRAAGLRRREIALEIRGKRMESLTQISRVEETLLYNAWLDYAISLLQYNRYEDAEPILNNCLAKYREWGTPEDIPFEYAKYNHKMAFIRMYQGKYNEAIELGQLGVRYMDETGNEALMLRFKFDLACIHLQSGMAENAFQLHKEVLEKRKIVCGKINEGTLQSYYAVGALHELRNEFIEAENCFRFALDQRRVAYWSIEAIARTQYHLANTLQAQKKDPDRAAKNYEEAKATLSRLLLLDIPDSLKNVEDEGVLFDHLLTVYGARFTGTKLLEYVR